MKKIAALLLLLPIFAFAADEEEQQQEETVQQVSVKPRTTANPMRLRTVMSFPAKLKTVKDTTEYILEPINYKLVLSPDAENQTKRILSRPLLRLHADGTIKSIEDALLKISGEDTVLVVDHENKLITLEFIDRNLAR